MSFKNRGRSVRPPHPGEMLREDFLPDYGLTPATLAKAIGTSRQTIYDLLGERRAVSPIMATRLGKLFGIPAEFWMRAQEGVDLWDAAQVDKKSIRPLRAA